MTWVRIIDVLRARARVTVITGNPVLPCHTLLAAGHFGKSRLGFVTAHEKGLDWHPPHRGRDLRLARGAACQERG